MAEKPKTYPQQIQELKQQLTDAQEQLTKYQEQVALIPQLNAEIQSLKDNASQASGSDDLAFATVKAQTTDLQQQIDSNAERVRQLALVNQQLTTHNEQLLSQLEGAHALEQRIEEKNAAIETATQNISDLNVAFGRAQRQFRDMIQEKDTVIETQSRELQTLRLATRTNERILADVRAALNEAPDVIGSLKYIVGINGKSTVA